MPSTFPASHVLKPSHPSHPSQAAPPYPRPSHISTSGPQPLSSDPGVVLEAMPPQGGGAGGWNHLVGLLDSVASMDLSGLAELVTRR